MSLNGELAREDGYGLPLGPCHRPLPGSKAAHIRHAATSGRIALSCAILRRLEDYPF